MRRASLAFVVLTACESAVALPSEAASTGVDASTSADAETTAASGDVPLPSTSTSTTGTFDPTTTSSSSGAAESDGDDGGCSFLCDPDGGSTWEECNLWDQDCPSGEKCSPWANDGGSAWNAWRCVPVDPNPDGIDESCTTDETGVTGIDSCVLGAICWNVDEETSVGTCVPHCIGSVDAPECADPNRICSFGGDAILTLCLATCDPLDAGACPASEGCYPINGGFVCAPDASGDGGGLFEPCEFINACSSGLLCANADVSGELCRTGVAGCCLPACNVNDPACPSMTTCTPWYEDGRVPPHFEHIGVCIAEVE